jgi:hypothetical protein
MAIVATPINSQPPDGAVNVSVTPLVVAILQVQSIGSAFVEQYDALDGEPIVVGW